MTINELYQEYGKLIIDAEILNAKILDFKKKIADELNKSSSENNTEKQ